MGPAPAPLHPARIVQHPVRVGHSTCFQEDDQVVVGVRQAQDLVLVVPVQGDPAAAGLRRPVHGDRRTAHPWRPGQPARGLFPRRSRGKDTLMQLSRQAEGGDRASAVLGIGAGSEHT